MFSEENIMQTLIAGTMISGFIGFVIGCYTISDDGGIGIRKARRAVGRGIMKIARMRAKLAVSSEVIRKL